MLQTTAAVICGEKDVRLRTFDLPQISDDELLVKNISNSICLSTYKAALLGSKHKRVPENIDEVPVMTGHEYAGVIVEVGANLRDKYKSGEPFVLQPAMAYRRVIHQATAMKLSVAMPLTPSSRKWLST